MDDSAMTLDEPSPTLYISGSPGCGKTALVNSVLGELKPEAGGVKTIFINCMALNNLDALWDRMFEEIDTEGKQKSKSRKAKGKDAIEALLTGIRTKWYVYLVFIGRIGSDIFIASLFWTN